MVGDGPHDANLGAKVFFIWGSLCVLSLLFALFLVPEMKGLSLEQVDKMLEEVSPWNSARWVPTTTFAAEMGHTHKDTAEEKNVTTDHVADAPAVQEA
jgi:MFS transporter, SP family, sugar:H+ symporter